MGGRGVVGIMVCLWGEKGCLGYNGLACKWSDLGVWGERGVTGCSGHDGVFGHEGVFWGEKGVWRVKRVFGG